MGYLAGLLGAVCAALGVLVGYYKARALMSERREMASKRVAENAIKQMRALREFVNKERIAQSEHAARVRSTAKAAAQIEQRLHTDDASVVADALNDALEL